MLEKSNPTAQPSPEEDFHAWAFAAAQAVRKGTLSLQQREQIAEELEDMGRSERHELRNRLSVLFGHLLKWRYQPERRGRSWQATIKRQRLDIQDLLQDNPSLRPRLSEIGERAYPRGVQLAVEETEIPEETFPATFQDTGWTWEQVLEMAFFPD